LEIGWHRLRKREKRLTKNGSGAVARKFDESNKCGRVYAAPIPRHPSWPDGRGPADKLNLVNPINSSVSQRHKVAFLVVVLVAIVALEAAAYRWGGVYAVAAGRIWAVMGIGFLILGSIEIGRAARDDLKQRNPAPVVLLVGILAATLPGIGGVELLPIYHEAPREAAHGLRSLDQTDWIYTGYGHIGYPNRQYLIAAAPSVVLGTGLIPLRLGFGLPFVFGMLLFWVGLRRFLAGHQWGSRAAPIVALAVLAFPFAVEHLHNYEQTIFPLSATLAATGWFVLTAAAPSVPRLLSLAWIGGLLGCSYTPNLSSWVLMIVSLVWLAIVSWREHRPSWVVSYGCVAIMVACFGGLSFLTRLDLHKVETGHIKSTAGSALVDGFSIFFFGDPQIFVPAVLYVPVMAALLLAVVGRLGFPAFTMAWWVVGTLAAACILNGNSLRPMTIEMFRVLVVVPPLLMLTTWFGRRGAEKGLFRNCPPAVAVFAVFLLVAQICSNLRSYADRYKPSLKEIAYADMLERRDDLRISPERPPIIVLLTDRHDIGNPDDLMPYFFPGFQLIRDPAEFDPGSIAGRPILFYADADRWRHDDPPWPGAGEPSKIVYDHPHHGHTMVVWGHSGD